MPVPGGGKKKEQREEEEEEEVEHLVYICYRSGDYRHCCCASSELEGLCFLGEVAELGFRVWRSNC